MPSRLQGGRTRLIGAGEGCKLEIAPDVESRLRFEVKNGSWRAMELLKRTWFGWCVVAVCGVLTTHLSAQTPSVVSDPGALVVFDTALEKLQSRAVSMKRWQYHQTLITEQLDKNGRMEAKGTWRSIYRQGDPDPVEIVSEKRVGTLSFFHRKKQDKPSAKSKSGDQADETSSGDRIETLGDLVKKYGLRERMLWKQLPDERAAGEMASVIQFSPLPGLKSKSREDRLLTVLSGTLWVSKIDGSVLKTEGRLDSPWSLFWVVARMTRLDFNYEAEAHPANRLLRKGKGGAETVVVFPFKTIRQKHSLSIEKFEPRTPRPK